MRSSEGVSIKHTHMNKFKVGLRRFLKGFFAGGLAQVALVIGPGLTFSNLEDVKSILTAVVFGFITGGILAVQKMISYTEPEVVEIDTLPDNPL